MRFLALSILGAAALAAQDQAAGTLSTLQQTAEKRAAEWDALARGLDAKISRMLPCDPRVRTTIDEVTRASQTWLAAYSQYLAAAANRARDDADGLKSVSDAQASFAAQLASERAETDQERAGIEGQMAALGESAKRRTALAESQKTLAGIADLTQRRGEQAQQVAARSDSLKASLADLGAAYQARAAALQNQGTALDSEFARWRDYYTARLARADTECAVTNPTGARRAPQGKKR